MIRLAVPADLPLIEASIEASYRNYIPKMGRKPQPMTHDYAAYVEENSVYVLMMDAELAGVLLMFQKPDHVYVDTIGIAPELQRKGLGTRLMAFAENRALTARLPLLRLHTNEAMTGNVDLYKRLGYVEMGRKGPTNVQVVYMEKRLQSALPK